MADLPTVSVITTAFNAERFIAAAARSVLDQCGVALEHVIVDDGSTDGTVAAVRRINDPRIHLVAAGRVGRGRALNLALAACRGEYVAILDADDVCHPLRLVTQLAAIQSSPETALIGTGQVLADMGGPVRWPPGAEPIARVVNGALVFYNPLSHSSVLARRSAIEHIGGYDESREALFDWDLYVRLAAQGGILAKLSTPLVAKRIHVGQFFEGRRTLSYAVECFRLQRRAIRLLDRSPLVNATLPALLAYRLLPRPLRLVVRRSVARLRGAPAPMVALGL